jgi:hypothetical protein
MEQSNENLTPQQKAAITRANKKDTPQKVSLKECEQSFSITRKKDGWYFVTTYFKDNELVKRDEVGPTMRAIVMDEFKITAQRYFEGLE